MIPNKDSNMRVIKAISMHDFKNQELISDGCFGQIYKAAWIPAKEKAAKAEKLEKIESADKIEKTENVHKIEKTENADKIEKTESTETIENTESTQKIENIESSEKIEKDDTEDNGELEKSDKDEKEEEKDEKETVEENDEKEKEDKEAKETVEENDEKEKEEKEAKEEYDNENSVEVVIKVLKNESSRRVLAERDRLAIPNHENVVKLLGAVYLWKGTTIAPWLVMESTPLGNLRKYIISQRNTGGISANGMMKIAWGIARGMEYLHANGIIHGDLATRNCLLGHKWTVKIGDLGYYDEKNARYYHDYKQSHIIAPLRWMSPENLPYRVNRGGYMIPCRPRQSFAGDVWAYGVVLYELWSRAKDPFHKLSDNYDVCDALLQGVTPTEFQKIKVRRHIWNLMHHCWEFQPSVRPKAADVVDHFEVNEGHVWLMANDYISI